MTAIEAEGRKEVEAGVRVPARRSRSVARAAAAAAAGSGDAVVEDGALAALRSTVELALKHGRLAGVAVARRASACWLCDDAKRVCVCACM